MIGEYEKIFDLGFLISGIYYIGSERPKAAMHLLYIAKADESGMWAHAFINFSRYLPNVSALVNLFQEQ